MTDKPTALFAGQKVLVTGASGFLGSHLCRRLHEEGAEIHAVSRSERTSEKNSIRWWRGEMSDIAAVRRTLLETKPDVIFHLSGLVTGVSGPELVLPTLHSLLVSTVNVLTVAAEIGCSRVVLAGSLTEPIPDHTEPTPASPYAAAKWASSAYGRMFYKLYGLPVVIVRVFMTYGPEQETGKLIPYVALSLLREQMPKLSSGSWEADWIYVDDVISGLVAAARAPNVVGTTIDLGSGTLVPVRKIVKHLVDLTGCRTVPVFGTLTDRPFEQLRVADVGHAHEMLGWRPTVSLLEGLRLTIDWYKRSLQG